jgi:hypothetical protein
MMFGPSFSRAQFSPPSSERKSALRFASTTA